MSAISPLELLAAAESLPHRGTPGSTCAWARGAALLVRQALEGWVTDTLRQKGVRLDRCPARIQFRCLGAYLDEAQARAAYQTWASLSDACHHHPYELGPSSSQLQMWIDGVRAFCAGSRIRSDADER